MKATYTVSTTVETHGTVQLTSTWCLAVYDIIQNGGKTYLNLGCSNTMQHNHIHDCWEQLTMGGLNEYTEVTGTDAQVLTGTIEALMDTHSLSWVKD